MDVINVRTMLELQRRFVREREWARFHTPKNLSMALAGESSELMEIFQWLTQAESKAVMKTPARAQAVRDEMADVFYYLPPWRVAGVAHDNVRDEMADVFYYLLRLADVLGVDLERAYFEKMERNAAKYPVKHAKGNARKYHEFLETKGLHPRKRKAPPQ